MGIPININTTREYRLHMWPNHGNGNWIIDSVTGQIDDVPDDHVGKFELSGGVGLLVFFFEAPTANFEDAYSMAHIKSPKEIIRIDEMNTISGNYGVSNPSNKAKIDGHVSFIQILDVDTYYPPPKGFPVTIPSFPINISKT